MLKFIDVGSVELGMFIHKLEGNWFQHPFWRARFLLTDETKLHKLRNSAIPGVIIDTSRGHDIAEAKPVTAATQGPDGAAGNVSRRLATFAAQRQRAETGDGDGDNGEEALRSLAPHAITREFGLALRVADTSHKAIANVFFEARLGKTIKAGVVGPVVNDIFASIQRNPHAFNGLMRCKRDNEYAYRHALATSALMVSLARDMKLPPREIHEAGLAGLVHDIGVAHLPVDLDAVGGDYRKLDPAVLADHVRLGHALLIAGGVSPVVARAVAEHHERIDGSGYPLGLKRDDISPLARMIAVCDTYDELANDIDGSAGLDPGAAIERILGRADGFDTDVLDSFVSAMGIYPVGATVLLRSGRLAMVIDQHPGDASRPKVRAFHSLVTGGMVAHIDIALAECYGEDAIESRIDPAEHGIADWPALREKLLLGGRKRRSPKKAA